MDKNLGPAILDTSFYVKQILKDNLLTKDYLQLSSEEVKYKMENLKTLLKNLLNTHKNSLSKPETLYFQRSLQLFQKLPVFYGLPKVHKSPMTLCPVVSTCGSLLSIFSTWLDFKIKELLPLVKSYLKNSSSVITDLKNLQLPQDALLFSGNAVSMYTNIDTFTGIHSINRLIVANQDQLPADFPKELFLRVLQLVMDNDIFHFRESYTGSNSPERHWEHQLPVLMQPSLMENLKTLQFSQSCITGDTSTTSSVYGCHPKQIKTHPGHPLKIH